MDKISKSAVALLLALLALSSICSWSLLAEARVTQFSAIQGAKPNFEKTIIHYNQSIVRRRSMKGDPPGLVLSPQLNPAPHQFQQNL
ncbi:hypothetical protein SLEP1_g56177 [Rubroshorea leprosula]|uniref:Transmembrane protein n=1 Tax=Rubroshorea leprosula TaxID=152421 RepID=A0AAV5MIU4_9ROSI|nr:hypothetical protein SLEP1_g56177 [Rubroshorea leprosula]